MTPTVYGPTLRYTVARGRASYKRHGINGYRWFVIDTLAQGSVAYADTKEAAQAEADRRNRVPA